MSLLMDTQTNRFWASVDFLATGEIVLHIPEECELPIRVLVSRGGRSTEYEPNNSEKPNNCDTCKHNKLERYSEVCDSCCGNNNHYEPKDEPQTETGMIKTIIHKMIDNTNIAEDAYPDLRQRLHDAVDEYEPQTDCPWK